MNVDDGLFDWFFKIMVTGMIGVGAWLWKNLVHDVRDLEKDQMQFRLESEKTYAKDTSVQNSLSRIHDRLDDVSTDIKTLIRSVAEK